MEEFKVGDYVFGKYGVESYVEGFILFIDEERNKIKIKCDNADVTLSTEDFSSERPEKLKKFLISKSKPTKY